MLEFFKFNPQYHFFLSLGFGLITLLLFILFKRIVNKFLLKLVARFKSKKHSTLLEEFNTTLKEPLEYWWLATGLYISLRISPFVATSKVAKPALIIGEEIQLSLDFISSAFLDQLYTSIVIILFTWVGCNLISLYEKLLVTLSSRVTLFDNSLLIRFSGKIFKFTIVLIGIIIVISLFADLQGILTSVGFLGAAFTFIAKDTLTDVLSGIVLMIDKPFAIGDWIQLSTLEGIVEDVSFRSTRIRTFTQGLVVVPNSTLSDDNIINWSAMPKRRVSFDLGFTYDTSKEKIELAISKIEDLLRNHPNIEPETALVYFNSFGDFSLNVTVIYFSRFTDLVGYSKLKEEINLKILDIVSESNLTIAFPTQSVFVENSSQIPN